MVGRTVCCPSGGSGRGRGGVWAGGRAGGRNKQYVHLPNFDVASDAFVTLRDLLTRNKAVASEVSSFTFATVRCTVNLRCTYLRST